MVASNVTHHSTFESHYQETHRVGQQKARELGFRAEQCHHKMLWLTQVD